jgi:hypothetical protein
MSERRDARLRAAALAVTGLSAGLALIAILFGRLNLDAAASLATTAFDPNYTTSFLIWTAAAIAILRYRLYDIDVLINRTIVYGAVSAMLAATYIAAVVLLQTLLRSVTEGSEVAVALSTLLVVVLFQPIRSCTQDAVNRRFYRARYDAARTIDAFSAPLRGEVELDNVRADLLDVVNSTVRPAHASVWLRGTPR